MPHTHQAQVDAFIIEQLTHVRDELTAIEQRAPELVQKALKNLTDIETDFFADTARTCELYTLIAHILPQLSHRSTESDKIFDTLHVSAQEIALIDTNLARTREDNIITEYLNRTPGKTIVNMYAFAIPNMVLKSQNLLAEIDSLSKQMIQDSAFDTRSLYTHGQKIAQYLVRARHALERIERTSPQENASMAVIRKGIADLESIHEQSKSILDKLTQAVCTAEIAKFAVSEEQSKLVPDQGRSSVLGPSSAPLFNAPENAQTPWGPNRTNSYSAVGSVPPAVDFDVKPPLNDNDGEAPSSLWDNRYVRTAAWGIGGIATLGVIASTAPVAAGLGLGTALLSSATSALGLGAGALGAAIANRDAIPVCLRAPKPVVHGLKRAQDNQPADTKKRKTKEAQDHKIGKVTEFFGNYARQFGQS